MFNCNLKVMQPQTVLIHVNDGSFNFLCYRLKLKWSTSLTALTNFLLKSAIFNSHGGNFLKKISHLQLKHSMVSYKSI